jgi:transcription initiation factor TFIIB
MPVAPDGRVLSPGEVLEEHVDVRKDEEYRRNLNIHLICPECQETPPNLIEEFSSGDTVCASCGLVLSGRIVDTRSEWRTFANDDQNSDDPSRVGDAANPLLNGSQLETSIAWGDGASRNRELYRAQNKTTNDKSTKNLLSAYKTIGSFCDAAHLPQTVSESAKHMFKILDDHKAFKGKSLESTIAGVISISCRLNRAPRSFREISALTRVPKKEVGRSHKVLAEFYKSLEKETKVTAGGMVFPSSGIDSTSNTDPNELCRRYCAALKLSKTANFVSEQLCDKITAVGSLAGRSPLSAAAACIYMTSHLMNEPRSPREVAEAAGVSDGTVRTAYRLLYQEKEKLIDPAWLEAKGGDMARLPGV